MGPIFLTIFISMIGFGIVIPVLPIYAKNAPFQLTPTELGWLVGVFSLVQLFSGPLIGRISDRIGRKPVLMVSICGAAVGYLITGAASVWWMLFLGRMIDGACGGNIATAQACIADVTPPAQRSKAMGFIGVAFGLGFILGPALGAMLSQWSAGAPFYFAGALSVFNAILVYVRLPETLSEEKRLHPTEKAPLGEVFAEGRGKFIGILLAASLISTTGFAFIHLLFALFCLDRFGWDARHSGYAFAYVGFIAVLVQGGLLRRLPMERIERPVAAFGAAMLAVSLWLLPHATSIAAFLGVTALLALGNGLLVPTLNGMASRHVHGRAQGRVLGLNASAGALGRFLGPSLAALPLPAAFSEWSRPLAGADLAAANQGYSHAFSGSAVLLLVACVLIIAMTPLEIKTPGEDPGVATA
jgi:DHA1 family tetracycline resistance protein-like MFS transporter